MPSSFWRRLWGWWREPADAGEVPDEVADESAPDELEVAGEEFAPEDESPPTVEAPPPADERPRVSEPLEPDPWLAGPGYVVDNADAARRLLQVRIWWRGVVYHNRIQDPVDDVGAPLPLADPAAVTAYVEVYRDRYYPQEVADGDAVPD